ncbi:MAG: drug/metabolite transporter (DMT)-like permease [Hyphomicrobiaceae bacterium]|jgi:drug/metabolite transporter (DMT)-like permease
MSERNTKHVLHRPSGRARLGFALTLVTVALWSMIPIGLRILLEGMDPMTITWFRFSAAALVVGTYLFLQGRLPRLASLDRHHWILLGVATLALAGNYGFYVLGLSRTNASTAQVVIQIAPMLLTVGSIVVFKERFAAVQWLGLCALVAGLVLFSSDQISHMAAGVDRYALGLVFMVAAAVTWATYGLAQKQLLGRLPSPAIMFCIYVGASVLFTPLARPLTVFDLEPAQLGALLFCIVNMVVAYGTFSEALAHWEATRVSALLATVPLATLVSLRIAEWLLPELVAPEPISITGFVGALFVVAGSAMAALGSASRRSASVEAVVEEESS